MGNLTTPPLDLITACAQRRCVLFVGSAMCAYAGLPNRNQLMLQLLVELPRISDEERLAMREMLDQAMFGSGLDDVGEVLTARFQKHILFDHVKQIYKLQVAHYGQAFLDLPEIGFESALTSNWDTMLENTFRDQKPVILTGSRNDPISDAQKTDAFIIAKLFGDLEDGNSFRFTTEDYRLGLYENQALAKIVTSHIESKSVFFLGVSLQGMQNFFLGIPWRLKRSKHFALVPRSAIKEAYVEKFRARYGIEMIPYEANEDYSSLERFVSTLRREVQNIRASSTGESKRKDPVKTSLSLDRVELRDIGTFNHVDIKLSSNWTVLLGNNGLGKSTILRAIALGLCGDDRSAAAVADKILRVNKNLGSVRLHVGTNVYETLLRVDGAQLRVETHGVTPVQRGDWVVLGFPSLRGIGASGSESPAFLPSSDASTPAVSDLLPLLSGAPDLRLQNLRSWIAYFDRFGESTKRVTQQRDAFFGILEDLMPGCMIKFEKIVGTQVYVKTLDGIIPIDQLSQGMMSLLGWIGTTLQRMYEIYPSSLKPELEPGLVLVDEIDAHLHPEWQQTIVPLFKKNFPRLQVIATTHSPLIASSLSESEILIVERHGDHCIVKKPSALDIKGMRADQLLTSSLFGLITTRGVNATEDINRYSYLLGKAPLTEVERIERDRLHTELSRSLRIGETELERSVESALIETLDSKTNPATIAERLDSARLFELKRQIASLEAAPQLLAASGNSLSSSKAKAASRKPMATRKLSEKDSNA